MILFSTIISFNCPSMIYTYHYKCCHSNDTECLTQWIYNFCGNFCGSHQSIGCLLLQLATETEFFCLVQKMAKRKHPDSDGEDDLMPQRKRHKADISYCKYKCGRKAADGKTRTGNRYDTCCRNCAVFNQRKHNKDKTKPDHDAECDKKFVDGYSFKLMGSKSRCTAHHRRQETSRKFIFCINDKYYYRLWNGINHNDYVLIHPLKYVTDKPSLDTYMQAFSYQKDLHTFVLTDALKLKIISSIQQYDKSPSLAQFIEQNAKNF